MDKYHKYQLIVALLEAKGFKSECFFFSIGGGEDEDDITILTKDDAALTWDYNSDRWYICNKSQLSYLDGFNYDNTIDINILL